MSKLKTLIKGFATAAFALTALASCSDWTDTESITLKEPDITQQNPELYAKYLESVRTYKQQPHKIVVTKFDNKVTYPAGQGEHLSALPDSIDYVILNNADNIGDWCVQEMKDIRDRKGTKTLYEINYNTIEAAYKAKLEADAANKPETSDEGEGDGSEEEPVADGFLSFCEERMDAYIAYFSQYGYDGINVVYNGVNTLGLTEDAKAQLTARQNVFFGKIAAWKDANPNAIMFFEGTPQNLLYDTALLQKATYLIVPCTTALSADELRLQTESSMDEGVPTDRFLFGVSMPVAGDDEIGYFSATNADGSKRYAVTGAALEVLTAGADYTKAGICVDHIQNDYYNVAKVYKNIREAIELMNPSK